ncbi:uncharacterized protein LOC124285996 isoform X2 [Haliotis rubra]|uniref:uncharacterized protein LOC124285996 isoform X2 n=1 Tax=Haliotis rubra TaxID=36100 RepID=UPI001EE5FC92|nr:uncharacterized protein LOC124285996 isoform X2 [Haliotis rubra]
MCHLWLSQTLATLTTVRGVSQCIKAKDCNDVFSREVSRKGIDEGMFCWFLRQKIDCLVNVKGSCTSDQKEWVQNDIDTAEGKYPKCDSASFVKSSLITSILLVLLAVFIRP